MRIFGLAALAVVTAYAVTGCKVDRVAQQEAKEVAKVVTDPVVEVKTISPRVAALDETLDVNGEVVTNDDTQISAQTSGKLVSVTVKEGDSISAGQVIAVLDSESLVQQNLQARAQLASLRAQLSSAQNNARLSPSRSKAAVRQAEAALRNAKVMLQKALNGARNEERDQAENNLRAAKSNLDTAKKQLERTKTLVKEGALAEAQLDSAKNGYEVALAQYDNALQANTLIKNVTRPEDIASAREMVRQAEQGLETAKANQKLDVTLQDQVNAARAQVESAQAQVAVTEKNLREATVRAPFSGRIYGKPLQVGTVVAPGTPIARVISGAGTYFDGQVPSSAVTKVQPGKMVTIKVDSFPDRSFTGKVISVSPLGDQVARLFSVRVQFLAGAGEVKPGMFAKASIVLNTIQDAVMVPSTSVISSSGKRFVFAVEGGTAKRLPVQTGIAKADYVQVIGLASNSKVVVKGQDRLVDGAKVSEAK